MRSYILRRELIMTKIGATVAIFFMLAISAIAADPVDDTFRKVNKHIWGVPDQRPAPQQAPQQTPPAEQRPAPKAKEEAPAPAPVVSQSVPAEDEHFIQPDDYFVQKHDLGTHTWIWVDLSKMVSEPTAASKGEAEFMKVRDGQNYWTAYYWKTRIAAQSELKMGMHAIIFNDNQREGVYQAPAAKDRARGGGWFYAKITDMSDTYKGYVTVSGNYKVGLKNLRLIIR